MHLNSKK